MNIQYDAKDFRNAADYVETYEVFEEHDREIAVLLRQGADAMDEVENLRAENERLRDALKDAIPWACLKCTLWNSRAARCSLGSGACTQVRNWQELLEGGEK